MTYSKAKKKYFINRKWLIKKLKKYGNLCHGNDRFTFYYCDPFFVGKEAAEINYEFTYLPKQNLYKRKIRQLKLMLSNLEKRRKTIPEV